MMLRQASSRNCRLCSQGQTETTRDICQYARVLTPSTCKERTEMADEADHAWRIRTKDRGKSCLIGKGRKGWNRSEPNQDCCRWLAAQTHWPRLFRAFLYDPRRPARRPLFESLVLLLHRPSSPAVNLSYPLTASSLPAHSISFIPSILLCAQLDSSEVLGRTPHSLDRLLITCRRMDNWRVAVLGDGGVGKTALAVQASLLFLVYSFRRMTNSQFTLNCFVGKPSRHVSIAPKLTLRPCDFNNRGVSRVIPLDHILAHLSCRRMILR